MRRATMRSEFCVAALHFACFTIDPHGVGPLQSNEDAVLKFSAPTSVKELHSFLCTANYYFNFVPRFAKISEPICYLLRKDIPWLWTSDCESAFKSIKEEIALNLMLPHFDANLATSVSTNASSEAIGAVLSQVQRGEERPVARILSPTVLPPSMACRVDL